MSEKLVQFPILGNFDYDPEEFLNLIKKKPNAFVLLGLIVFTLAKRDTPSYGLDINEIYLSDSLFKSTYNKYVLTSYQRDRSIKDLVNLCFIKIRNGPTKRMRIITLLINPFVFNMRSL